MRIIAQVSLELPGQNVLLRSQITGVASTAAQAEDIVADREFIVKGTAEAVKDLAGQLSALMEPKLKLTKSDPATKRRPIQRGGPVQGRPIQGGQ